MYYTTTELAKKLHYKSRRTLVQALQNNESSKVKNEFLSNIWKTKVKFGKAHLFKKNEIDNLLKNL